MCYDTLGVVLLGKLQESRYQAPYLSVQSLYHCQKVSRGFLVLSSKSVESDSPNSHVLFRRNT